MYMNFCHGVFTFQLYFDAVSVESCMIQSKDMYIYIQEYFVMELLYFNIFCCPTPDSCMIQSKDMYIYIQEYFVMELLYFNIFWCPTPDSCMIQSKNMFIFVQGSLAVSSILLCDNYIPPFHTPLIFDKMEMGIRLFFMLIQVSLG